MKKYLSIIAVAAMAAYATSALAQGYVLFNNNSANTVKMWADATGSTTMNVASGNGKVQIAYAAPGTTYNGWNGTGTAAWLQANPGWTLGPTTGIVPAGRFNGQTIQLTGPGITTSADYVILGWTGTHNTFDDALAAGAMVNVSANKLTTALETSNTVPPPQLATTFTGLTLQPIPEPSVFALAGLGAAALLIFRRRK